MSGWRFVLFLSIVLGVWALMHAYVFWRFSTIPWLSARIPTGVLVALAVILWASYPVSRFLESHRWAVIGQPLELFAANWLGVMFLLFAALFFVEVITLGGIWRESLKGWAVIVAGILSIVAIGQGLRPPVVRDYEVKLDGLPREHDGKTLVAVSDLHLGTLLGERWMRQLIERIDALHPDAVVIVGDLVDGNVAHVERLLPVLQRLRAPWGVWAVTGNHEFYAGLAGSVKLLEEAGYHVLRNRWEQAAPGLVIAGVDDLTALRQTGAKDHAAENALAGRPSGATIFLSHTPWRAEVPAKLGAGLMLSGHTHGGQIWPFNFLVRLEYALLGGRYEVDGMTVIVCRGTGTWGPRMRLWQPSEILRIKLRAA